MNKVITMVCMVMCLLIIIASFFSIITPSKVNVIAYTWGSRGVVVQQVQQKLKEWDYYKDNIDGVYGYETWAAIKNFQQKNNILPDGIAGNVTLAKLGIFPSDAVAAANMEKGVYTWGMTGQVVKDIQYKLREWGYFNGAIDGVYGYATSEAVKKFQAKNGLQADGVVGGKTLSKIGLSSGQAQSPSKTPTKNVSRDVTILASAIHGESRGEPYIGKVAVGAVILNRTRDSRFPHTIAGVIYQPGAFTAVDDGQINLAPNEETIRAAKDALNGWDPTGGCVYYWNPATATSKWIWSRDIVTIIGKHYFGK